MKKLLTFSTILFFVFFHLVSKKAQEISDHSVETDSVYVEGESLSEENDLSVGRFQKSIEKDSQIYLDKISNTNTKNSKGGTSRSPASEEEDTAKESKARSGLVVNYRATSSDENKAKSSSKGKRVVAPKTAKANTSQSQNNQTNSENSDSDKSGTRTETGISGGEGFDSGGDSSTAASSSSRASSSDSFNTDEVDMAKFEVLSVSPKDKSIDVLVDEGNIKLTFNQTLDCSTLNSNGLVIKRNSTLVSGTYSCNGKEAVFTTTNKKFKYSSLYTISTTVQLKDYKGRAIFPNFTSNFTTESGVLSISLGENHTCVVVDEKVKCFGDNQYSQLGINSGVYLTKGLVGQEMGVALEGVKFGSDVIVGKKVFAGPRNSCAIDQSDKLYCWGDNSKNQLDTHILTNTAAIEFDSIYLGVGVAQDVAIGMDHICVLTSQREVKCFGDNSKGQFVTPGDSVDFGMSIPIKIVAGDYFTCALLLDGSVSCWGANNFGQLGLDNSVTYNEPVNAGNVSIPTNVTDIVAGSSHACALYKDTGFTCWGKNSEGQLGIDPAVRKSVGLKVNDITTYSATKKTFADSRKIVAIYAAGDSSCVIADDNELYCFGNNSSGQFGLGHTNSITDFSSVSSTHFGAGTDAYISNEEGVYLFDIGVNHACGYMESGKLVCLGRNDYGQLGNGSNSGVGDSASYIGTEPSESIVVDDYPVSFNIVEGSGTNTRNVNIVLMWDNSLQYDQYIASESVGCPSGVYESAVNSAPPEVVTSHPFTLSTGEGRKTVYLRLKNSVTGVMSDCLRRDIVYYENSPSGSTITGPVVTSTLLNDFKVTSANGENIAMAIGSCPSTYSGSYNVLKGNHRFSLSDIADGDQEVVAYIQNPLGQECISTTVKLDRTGPLCSFDVGFTTTMTAVNSEETVDLRKYTCFEALPVEVTSESCKLEGPNGAVALFDWKNCETLTDGYDLNSTDNPDGSYTYTIKAVDSLGNLSSEVSHTWIKDTVKPVCTYTGAYPISGNIGRNSENVTFACTDATTLVVECSVDGAPYSLCDSATNLNLTGLSEGSHTLNVRATDESGLTSDVINMTWIVDTQAPVCSFTGA
ncbi:Ig-like domain-containing protein, partial [Bacteriovorax sp. Seq25_V]|uniref:Ig-like domain-containing protein n=1 Tax=Bacteriovorax sp. Seq25_V TaxID=1201288 RepID=UPI000389F5DF